MARYALVIGVGENRSPLPSLSKTVGDARAIAAALEVQGDFRVDCVTRPEQLTYATLTEAIKQFVNQKAKTAEVALIYYTGHAVPVVDGFAEETEVFLAPVNCGLKWDGDRCTDQQNGISLKSLSALLAKADLKNLVMLLDCCHSGALTEPAALDQTFAGFRSKNYWLLTSCRHFERSWAKESDAHSLFSGSVLRGLALEQADDRGEITAGKLFGFVTEELRQARQEPQQLSVGGSVIVARHRQSVVVEGVDASIEPYRGLSAFTPETKRFFFGRDGVLLELLRKLQDCNFVPVIGPSGIGKSSIVRAGLIPRVTEQGWRVLGPMNPDEDPFVMLKQAIEKALAAECPTTQLRQLRDCVGPDGSLLDLAAQLPGEGTFLLIVDQFEELFTYRQSTQPEFIRQLVAIGDRSNSRLKVVTTMRSDFVNDWLATGQPPQVIQSQTVYVGPLRGDDLRDAIVKPAEQLGYGFGEGLLELVLADVEAEPNSLPLLEFTLEALWEKRDRQKQLLTAAAYTEMGKLQGALNSRAEALYGSQQLTEQDWTRRICLGLVRIGKGDDDTRQRRLKSELLALAADGTSRQRIEDVIDDLVKGRLLASDEGVVDLAHEALMGGWERFTEWRQQDRDQQRVRQRVADAREEWLERGEIDAYLLPKGLLGELRELAAVDRDELLETAELGDFFRLSDEQDQASVAALKQALAIANLREARTKILALPPAKIVDKTLMAIAAVGESLDQLQDAITPVQDALHHAWAKVQERLKLEGHGSAVICVAFSPLGNCIVSGSGDNTLRLWDLEGRAIGEPFQGHSASVGSVAFSPSGDRIVSGSADNTLRLWDLQGQMIGEPFQGHSASVGSVAFSPSGDRIVSGSTDTTLRLWDLQGRTIGAPFQGHSYGVDAVAFSPSGECIVSGSTDNTLRLWDLQGQMIGEPFQGHSNSVNAVAFSPSGECIVSGSQDSTLRLWDLEGRIIGAPFQGHSYAVRAVAFSPSGKRIASGCVDGTLQMWDLEGRTIGDPFQGHSYGINAVAFSPSGDCIVSGSGDSTLRLWDLEGRRITAGITAGSGSTKGKPFQGHSNSVNAVAFSPSGECIVSGSEDNTLRLWGLDGRTIGKPFQGHSNPVTAVAFSPSGELIVSGSEDNTLRLWDLEGKTIGKPFQDDHSDFWFNAVAFSPSGEHIVSGCVDDTLQLWDLKGRAIGEPFQGHSSQILTVAFSPLGERIVSGCDEGSLRVWDLEGRTIGEPFQGHSGWVWSAAFNPSGDLIVSGSNDGSLRLWDLEGRAIGEPFQGHSSSVRAVAFSPSGNLIVSGSEDSTLRLWDLEGRTIGDPFQGHSHSVTSVAFSPNGDLIVSGSEDGTLRLWRGGTWRNWLHDCCTKLMFHSDLVSPTTDFARQACQVCQAQAWTRPETARFLRAQAHALQRQGKPNEANAKLAEADRLERKNEGE
jgi:WD40 repeat protein